MDFQIGDRIRYKVNGYEIIGAVLEVLGDEVAIVTHFIKGVRVNNVVCVEKKKLTLITE